MSNVNNVGLVDEANAAAINDSDDENFNLDDEANQSAQIEEDKDPVTEL